MSSLVYILAEQAESTGFLDQVTGVITGRGPYLIFLFLCLFGFYLMMTHKNALKGIVGLTLFQTGIIVFFIFLAFIGGTQVTVAILSEEQVSAYKYDKKNGNTAKDNHKDHDHHTDEHKDNTVHEVKVEADLRELDPQGMPEPNPNYRDMTKKYPKLATAIQVQPPQNPLPHALMLTAIVVGVATLGVAIAIMLRMNKETGSIEDEALEGEDD